MAPNKHEFNRGEVPERSIGAVLKTAGCKPRGFESHPLRQVFRVWEPSIGAYTVSSSGPDRGRVGARAE